MTIASVLAIALVAFGGLLFIAALLAGHVGRHIDEAAEEISNAIKEGK